MPSDARAVPTIAVVVPAHRDGHELRRCLSALCHGDPRPDELIVVVDGADPATVATAERYADRVVALADSRGPARARNAGVSASVSDVVYFVDSDVLVPRDTIAQLREVFTRREDLDAVIGSYDDDPPAPGLVSQYKNLLNNHVHQTAGVEGSTFWGACGAIRRGAFEALGGFDEGYTRPCVEDIELGQRLIAAGGRIEVVKQLQVTHLKRWTPGSLLRADVLDRAVPWSELILDGAGFVDDLNVARVQRAKTLVAVCALLAGTLGIRRSAGRRAAAAGVGVLLVLDWPLLRFFARKRGSAFAVGAAGWHWFSYLYSAAAFGWVVLRRALRR